MSKKLRVRKQEVKDTMGISFRGIEYVYSIGAGDVSNVKIAHRRASIVSLLSKATNGGTPLVVAYRDGRVNFFVPFNPEGYEVIDHDGEYWDIVYAHEGPWAYVYRLYPDGLLEGQWEYTGNALVG